MIETSIIGVEFDDCYQTDIIYELNEVEINMIDFENLMKNKKASGRLKDMIYFETLQQKKKAIGS